MNRLVVLAIFKVRHAWGGSIRDEWRRKYLDEGEGAWIDALSYLMVSLPVLLFLGILLASPIYALRADGFIPVAVGYFLPLWPLLAVGCAEIECRQRMRRYPAYMTSEDVRTDRYHYRSWDFPGNRRILLMSDVVSASVAAVISLLLANAIGPV